jgi:hypothetical protein
MRSCRGC